MQFHAASGDMQHATGTCLYAFLSKDTILAYLTDRLHVCRFHSWVLWLRLHS